jgi:hypothetical protein
MSNEQNNQHQNPSGNKKLPLLVPGGPEDKSNTIYRQDAWRAKLVSLVQGLLVEVDQEKVIDGVVHVLETYDEVIMKVSETVSKKTSFNFDSVEVGLAIDAKGNVGIASLGVQHSLKFAWKPRIS